MLHLIPLTVTIAISTAWSAEAKYTVADPVAVLQYSAASFIETINSSSLTMDSDEFVARMIAAGIPDIEMSATQPASPKIKPVPASTAPDPGASSIPAGPQDSLGLTPQPSQASLASM